MVKKAFHILQPVARSKTQGDCHVKYVNSLQNIVQCIKKITSQASVPNFIRFGTQ